MLDEKCEGHYEDSLKRAFIDTVHIHILHNLC